MPKKTPQEALEAKIRLELEEIARKYNVVLELEEGMGAGVLVVRPRSQPYRKVPPFTGAVYVESIE